LRAHRNLIAGLVWPQMLVFKRCRVPDSLYAGARTCRVGHARMVGGRCCSSS